jgi:hypothetical protein
MNIEAFYSWHSLFISTLTIDHRLFQTLTADIKRDIESETEKIPVYQRINHKVVYSKQYILLERRKKVKEAKQINKTCYGFKFLEAKREIRKYSIRFRVSFRFYSRIGVFCLTSLTHVLFLDNVIFLSNSILNHMYIVLPYLPVKMISCHSRSFSKQTRAQHHYFFHISGLKRQ